MDADSIHPDLPIEIIDLIIDELLLDISKPTSLKASLPIFSSLALVCLSFRHIVNVIRFSSFYVTVRDANAGPHSGQRAFLLALLEADTKIWGGGCTHGFRSTIVQQIRTLSVDVTVPFGNDGCDLRELVPLLCSVFQTPQTVKPSMVRAFDSYQLDPQTLSVAFAVQGFPDENPAVLWGRMDQTFVDAFRRVCTASNVEGLWLKNCVWFPPSLLRDMKAKSLRLDNCTLEIVPSPWNKPRYCDTWVTSGEQLLSSSFRSVSQYFVKTLVIFGEDFVWMDLLYALMDPMLALEKLHIRTTVTGQFLLLFYSLPAQFKRETSDFEWLFPHVKVMLLDMSLIPETTERRQGLFHLLPHITPNLRRLELQYGVVIPRDNAKEDLIAYIKDIFRRLNTTFLDGHISSASERIPIKLTHVVLHFFVTHESFQRISLADEKAFKDALVDLVQNSFPLVFASRKVALDVRITVDSNQDAVRRKRHIDCFGLSDT